MFLASRITAFLVVIALIALFAKNAVVSSQWKKSPEPPGGMIDIGGRRLYARITGAGGPAVVILHDILSYSPEWWEIQDRLSTLTRVVTYDRAGYGWSEARSDAGTSRRIVNDLESLLRQIELTGPCILVGHGIGGLYALQYAFAHPQLVCAVVLVDPVTMYERRFREGLSDTVFRNLIDRTSYLQSLRIASYSGLIRLLNIKPGTYISGKTRDILKNHSSLASSYDAMHNEYSANLEESIKQIGLARAALSVPVIVIRPDREREIDEYQSFGLSMDEASRIDAIKTGAFQDTVELSYDGRILTSSKGGHNLHQTDPDLIVATVSSFVRP
jgi:pimeloyl-ACP methyl ester carboxylesterase